MITLIIMTLLLILFFVLITTFSLCCFLMPYVSGTIGSLVLSAVCPDIKNLIPGHPNLSIISVIVIVNLLIFILIRIEQTNTATIVLTSSAMINLIVLVAISDIKIDSVNFGIFTSVVYIAFMVFFLMTNYGKNLKSRYCSRNILWSIISSLMYTASVGMDLLILLGLIWSSYIEYIGNEGLLKSYNNVSLIASLIIMALVFIMCLMRDMIERRNV